MSDEAGELPAGFTAAGRVFDITTTADLSPHAVELRLPGRPPPEGALPTVLHLNDRGGWEALPASYDDGFYVTTTASFSPFVPGFISDAAEWVTNSAADVVEAAGRLGFVDSISDWITGRTDPPDPCGREAYPWVADTGAPPDGAFHVCVKANAAEDGAERVEVELKSNRNFAMWVVVPDNDADYVWVEGADWGLLGPVINGVVPGPDDRVLLPPGARMTVGYRRPPVTSVDHTFFAYQDNWSIAATALIDQLGSVGLLGVAVSGLVCVGEDTSTVDRIATCLGLGSDLADAELESIIDEAIEQGRIAIADGDFDTFNDRLMESIRANSLRERLGTISRGLFWAELASKWSTAANDAATGNATLAGTYILTLIPSAPQSGAGPSSQAQPAVLSGDGIGSVKFGDDADAAATALVGALGPPASDSGWQATGYDPNSQDDQCLTPAIRRLRWPNLTLVFAEYDPATGDFSRRTFVSYAHYNYEPGTQSTPQLYTTGGTGLGTPETEALEAHPDRVSFDFGFDTGDGMTVLFDGDLNVNWIGAGTELCSP